MIYYPLSIKIIKLNNLKVEYSTISKYYTPYKINTIILLQLQYYNLTQYSILLPFS